MLPVVQLDAKGLYTFNNLLSQVPPGAMQIANNIVIDRPGVAETRRGMDFYGTALPSNAIKGFVYLTKLLWYCTGGQLVYDSDGAGTWSNYSGSFFPPSGNFINSAQANGNFYFTTNNGVYKIATLTGTPVQAGCPPALDLSAALAGVGSAVNNNAQVAYTVLWSYTDANNNLIQGPASSWTFLTNTAGTTQNVTLTVTIPATITTAYTLQVYRTPNTTSSSVVPGNNFQLATSYQPNSTDIANHYLTITDTVPDSLLGAYSPYADGQTNNYPNTPPPLCQDICTYNGMTFYFNWQTIQQCTLTLDSVGGGSGIQVGDTFKVTDLGGTSYTYTAAVANNAAARQFAVYTGGTIAQNIDATGRNLAAMINQDPNNTYWYAYYQTGTNVLPGGIVLQARNLQQGKFYVNSSRQTCWTPVIPASGQTYISGNLAQPGAFLVSKPNQPEAVPLVFNNPVQTGSVSVILYRGIALQDAVYLFTNAGVFRVTGSDPTSLQVVLYDSSALLLGLQTPQILNNSIYYFSSQGICSVSSGGNQIVSRNVERDVIQLSVLTNFTSLAFGTGYESDRKYLLYAPTSGSDSNATQTYVYNWITQCWTRWTKAVTAAIVNPANNKLYVANASGLVLQERKNFQNSDYSDEHYAVTINSVNLSGLTVTLASSANVQIGDTLQQVVSGTQYSAQVTSNNQGTGVVGVSSAVGFTAGSATDYRAIFTQIRFAPITCGFAEYNKKFLSWQFYFENANFATITALFSSDYQITQESQTLTPRSSNGWGTLPWGTFNWGVSNVPEQAINAYPTSNTSWAHWVVIELQLTQAFTWLALNGVSATFDIESTRGT